MLMRADAKEAIKWETSFNSMGKAVLQIRWMGKFKNSLYALIPKSMGFFNQNSGFLNMVIYWETVEKPQK